MKAKLMSGFSFVVQNGVVIQHRVGSPETWQLTYDANWTLERVGLRLAVSNGPLLALAYEEIDVVVREGRTQRTLAEFDASILLDPDYSSRLGDEEGLDPDPWAGFCRTIDIGTFLGQASTLHSRITFSNVFLKAIESALTHAARKKKGDLVVIARPILVVSSVGAAVIR